MEHAGFDRFTPTNLNPTAQEFRPTNPNLLPPPPPPPHTYYSYRYPYDFNTHRPQPVPVPVPVQVPVQVPVHIPSRLPQPSTTPTRSLLLSSVPSDVSESIIRRDLELFGDVRAVQMERLRDGLVTVHFYDLRQAIEALHEIQEQHMQQQYRLRKHFDALTLLSPENYAPLYGYHANSYSSTPLPPPAPGLIAGRAVWAQFTFPVAVDFPDGNNQGTLVVFNLNSDITAGTLGDIFETYGSVKELRETPLKKNQKFVEFYDTRDATKALVNVNGTEINGKTVVVEFSRPGGHKNGPKPNRFNTVSSIGTPPIILSRKFLSETHPYRPPPTPQSPSPSQSKKTGKKPPEEQGGCSWSKQRKGWRHTREKYDPRFLIKEDGVISECSGDSDSRTTVMIKNIPNKYSQKLLLNMLDSHCIHCNEQITGDGGGSGDQPLSSYDFVYLPIDFQNKCNVGYGFVNMTSPDATMRLYKAFHHQNWEVFNSKKICEVSYARLQGLDALKDHFKNSRFPCDAEEYMPVVFDPPRDGWRLTPASPIVGRSNLAPSDHDHDHDHVRLTRSELCNSNVTVVEDVGSDDTSNAATCSDSGGVEE